MEYAAGGNRSENSTCSVERLHRGGKAGAQSPLNAMLLAECIQEAELPAGVVNILPADREEGEYLALHPGVDKVSFTGSTTSGRRLASSCGERLRAITLELGGKSAAIFLDDADVPASVEALRLDRCAIQGRFAV